MNDQKKPFGDWRELCIIFLEFLTIVGLALFAGIGWVLCKIFGG